jgi:molybdenum cofactor cytidylyltransferase
MAIAALLLAAGAGRRFDASGTRLKLLEPAPCGPHAGIPLALAAARQLRAEFDEVHAVVRPATTAPQRQLHALLADAGCALIVCTDAEHGMGASLACGVRATDTADAWLIALADMPAIAAATIRAVHHALKTGAVCAAPHYGDRRGHPVGLSAVCRDELLALHGDEGARAVLQRHPLRLIDVDDPGCVLDIDAPDQLAR